MKVHRRWYISGREDIFRKKTTRTNQPIGFQIEKGRRSIGTHKERESWSIDAVPTFIDPHYDDLLWFCFVLQTPSGKPRNTNQGNSILPQIKVDNDHPVCIILIFIVPQSVAVQDEENNYTERS